MSDERISRWMGPLGLLIVIAVFVGFGPLSGSSPGENASGAKVAAYYNSHVAMSWASIYVVGFGLALLILFVSQLRTVLRKTGGEQTFWPNVVFAAAIILVAGIILAGTFQVILILAAHNHELTIVKVANFVGDNNELGFLFGIALLTLASGAGILLNRSTEPLPRTLGWYSLLVGVVTCLGPLGFFGLFGFGIWLIATGFVIGTKARRSAKALPPELATSNLA
jgi:MFS family permease